MVHAVCVCLFVDIALVFCCSRLIFVALLLEPHPHLCYPFNHCPDPDLDYHLSSQVDLLLHMHGGQYAKIGEPEDVVAVAVGSGTSSGAVAPSTMA